MFGLDSCVTRKLLSRNSYCAGQKTQNARGTYERVQDLRPYRRSRGGWGKGLGNYTALAPRRETPCQIGAPSCRATRLDRAETKAIAQKGVWHARGNRATEDGVTHAAVRGHRHGRLVAPPRG